MTDPALRSRRFLLALLVGLLVVAVWIAWPFRTALVLALVLGFALHPLYRALRRVVRWRVVAALVVLLLVLAALVVPVALVARELVDQAGAVQASLQDPSGMETQAVELLGRFGVPEDVAQARIAQAGTMAAAWLQSIALRALGTAPEVVVGFVVFFLTLFYVLTDGERLVAFFRRHVPLVEARRERLLGQAGDQVRAILLGSFLVYLIQGVVAGIGWWIFGFPAPVFWGFVMTIMAILPFMGPPLVMVPAGILAIAQGDLVAGIGIIVWTVIAVGLIDDVVRPWLIGRRAQIHPALVLVGTLGGLQVFGIAGFLVGPLLLGLVAPVLDVWAEDADPAPAARETPPGAPPEDEPPVPRATTRRPRST